MNFLSTFIGRRSDAFVRYHALPLRTVAPHAAPFHSSRVSQGSKSKSSKTTRNERRAEQKGLSHITVVSHWEAKFFDMYLLKTMDDMLRSDLKYEPEPEELLVAYWAMPLLWMDPEAFLGLTPYATPAMSIAELTTRPWTPEFRRFVHEGAVQLRWLTYWWRIKTTVIVSGIVGSIGSAVYLLWKVTKMLPQWIASLGGPDVEEESETCSQDEEVEAT